MLLHVLAHRYPGKVSVIFSRLQMRKRRCTKMLTHSFEAVAPNSNPGPSDSRVPVVPTSQTLGWMCSARRCWIKLALWFPQERRGCQGPHQTPGISSCSSACSRHLAYTGSTVDWMLSLRSQSLVCLQSPCSGCCHFAEPSKWQREPCR